MKLILRNVVMLSIISAILAFYTLPTSTAREKLQAITEQIDIELSIIEKKGDQPRVLSKQLIREIAHFSNSCPLEKVIVSSRGKKDQYSVEKGKLLLALLNRKLDPSTYKKIFKTVTFENAFLKDADLKTTNLNGIQLSSAYLVGVDLNNTNLEGVDLQKANLSKANLRGANLKKANLRRAILSHSDMSNAVLTKANLVGAKFGHVILDNTDFTGANLHGADFVNEMPHLIKP